MPRMRWHTTSSRPQQTRKSELGVGAVHGGLAPTDDGKKESCQTHRTLLFHSCSGIHELGSREERPLDLAGGHIRAAGRGLDHLIADMQDPQLANAAREADVPTESTSV